MNEQVNIQQTVLTTPLFLSDVEHVTISAGRLDRWPRDHTAQLAGSLTRMVPRSGLFDGLGLQLRRRELLATETIGDDKPDSFMDPNETSTARIQ